VGGRSGRQAELPWGEQTSPASDFSTIHDLPQQLAHLSLCTYSKTTVGAGKFAEKKRLPALKGHTAPHDSLHYAGWGPQASAPASSSHALASAGVTARMGAAGGLSEVTSPSLEG